MIGDFKKKNKNSTKPKKKTNVVYSLVNEICKFITDYDLNGYDKKGYKKHGYNRYGYNKKGYDRNGYDRHGYNQVTKKTKISY